MRKINVLTLFPKLVSDAIAWGVVGQSLKHNILSVRVADLREFTQDPHRTVDDRPYGGGDGMIMLAEPLALAMKSLGDEAGVRVFLSPQGERWSDKLAREFARDLENSNLTLVCGRYGGVDQRFLNSFVDRQISVGDFILSGGEFAALSVIDSIARLLPGVLGNEKSQSQDSFANGLLEAPQFTRPEEIFDQAVPEVLRSGDHQKIFEFREALSLAVTRERRPDLFFEDHKVHWLEALQVLKRYSYEELKSCGLAKHTLEEILK